MNKNYYISLIAKKLSNELNASQLKDLNNWLNEGNNNAKTFEDIKSVWDLSANYKSNIAIDTSLAYDSFINKYEIPVSKIDVESILGQTKPSNFRFAIIGLLIFSFISLGYFFGKDKFSSKSNDNMFAIELEIEDKSSVTLAPNSSFRNGDADALTAESADLYEKILATNNATDLSSVQKSSITYDPQLSNYNVESVKGQAFFDLRSVDGNPLFIGLDGGRSLSTKDASFNVQNYDNDDATVIDVQLGTVVFFDGNGNSFLIPEGNRAIFDKNQERLTQVENPTINPFKWKEGILIFDNTTLDDVFIKIERHYGVNVDIVDNSSTADKNFTATFPISSGLNECLNFLKESIPMEIRRKGARNVEISKIQ